MKAINKNIENIWNLILEKLIMMRPESIGMNTYEDKKLEKLQIESILPTRAGLTRAQLCQ